jgi:hypothetical protein
MPTKASSSTVHPCNTALCPAKHRLEYICYQNISETDTTRISFDNGLVADCFSNMSQIANIIVEQEYLLIALPSDKSIYHGNCTRASPRCCTEVQLPKLVFKLWVVLEQNMVHWYLLVCSFPLKRSFYTLQVEC